MQDTTKIKVGDIVHATFAWREDEMPTDKNFFTGKVKSIIRKRPNIVYFELENVFNLLSLPHDKTEHRF